MKEDEGMQEEVEGIGVGIREDGCRDEGRMGVGMSEGG